MKLKKAETAAVILTLLLTAAAAACVLCSPGECVVEVEPVFRQEAPQEQAEGQKININTADEQQLTELPGVGEALAARIAQYREENGGFAAIEDIMQVSGIGQGTFEEIKGLITVN